MTTTEQLRQLGATEYQIQYARTCYKVHFKDVEKVELIAPNTFRFWHKEDEVFGIWFDECELPASR